MDATEGAPVTTLAATPNLTSSMGRYRLPPHSHIPSHNTDEGVASTSTLPRSGTLHV